MKLKNMFFTQMTIEEVDYSFDYSTDPIILTDPNCNLLNSYKLLKKNIRYKFLFTDDNNNVLQYIFYKNNMEDYKLLLHNVAQYFYNKNKNKFYKYEFLDKVKHEIIELRKFIIKFLDGEKSYIENTLQLQTPKDGKLSVQTSIENVLYKNIFSDPYNFYDNFPVLNNMVYRCRNLKLQKNNFTNNFALNHFLVNHLDSIDDIEKNPNTLITVYIIYCNDQYKTKLYNYLIGKTKQLQLKLDIQNYDANKRKTIWAFN